MQPKRLFRSRTNKVFAGICGGLGDFFFVDPVIMRVLMLIFVFLGPGLFVYLISWLIIPKALHSDTAGSVGSEESAHLTSDAIKNIRHLYRSSNDKMLAGVCGGISEYFGIDSTFVRLGVVLLAFLGGIGVWMYIISIFVIPKHS